LVAAALIEIAGGALIAVGLVTRIAAFILRRDGGRLFDVPRIAVLLAGGEPAR
jgi:hypothetical protein